MPLRVLLVDDSQVDVELVVEELRYGGYEPAWERVETAAALTAALDREPWDVITCDWVMPQFSGPAALALLQERQVDLPIIVVSGQVGEEYAVTAMKAGAHDFVSKQKLARLCPAIARELKETQARREHKQAGKALAAAYEQLRLITDNMLDMLSLVSVDAVSQYISPSHQRILGYAPEDLLGRRAFDFFHPEDVAPVTSAFEASIKNDTTGRVEFRHRHADGHYVWLEAVGRPFFDDHGSVVGVVVNGRDITERKQAEEALRLTQFAMDQASDAVFWRDPGGGFFYVNDSACQRLGYTREQLLRMHVWDIDPDFPPTRWPAYWEELKAKGSLTFETRHQRRDGSTFPVEVTVRYLRHEDQEYACAFARDISERMQAEEMLRRSEDKFRLIFNNTNDAVFVLDLDGQFLEVNQVMCTRLQYTREELLKMTVRDISTADAARVGERLRKILQDGYAVFETAHVRQDGTVIPVEVSARTIEYEGKPAILSVDRDITERKRAEEMLRQSEERLRLAQKAAQVVTWDWDLLSGMTTWSSPIAAELGLPPGTFDGTYEGFLALVHPKDRDFVRQAVARAISDDADYNAEFRLMKADGGIQWAASRGHALRNESGQAVSMLGVSQDITKRKLAEEALYVTQFSMDHAGDAMFWTNADGRFLYVNHGASDRLGYTREQLLTMHVWDIDPDYSMDRWPAHWEELKEKGTLTFETRHRRHDGTIFPAELTVKYLQHGELKYACTSARDITERKRAELEYGTILQTASDGFWILDVQGNILDVNEAYCQLSGYSRAELLTMNVRDIEAVESASEVAQHIRQVMEAGHGHFEVHHRRNDGRVLEIAISTNFRDVSGGRFFVFLGDITERKQSEEALRESEQRFRLVVENIDEVFWLADIRLEHMYYVSPSYQRVWGRTPESLYQHPKSFLDAMHPEDRDRLATALEVQKAGQNPFEQEYRIIRPDGSMRWILDHGFPVRNPTSQVVHYVGVARDITERKRAEQEIRRLNADLERRVAERTVQFEVANKELETFSYSVSHDLRAPLRAVDGFSTMLLDRYGAQFDAQGRHYLQRVREGTQRMGELINDLLLLSRITRTEMHRQPVDLSAMARAIAADLRKTQPERQVEFVIADGVVVEGDAGLLRAALENLLGNAWKYTSKHLTGRIEFGVSHQDGPPVYFVRDDGAGFDMAYVSKLFGTFQRLHATDEFEGTGIGLATVQRIIHRHGGRVWAEGAVEQGATFYFTLPEAALHHEDSPTENEAPGGALTAR